MVFRGKPSKACLRCRIRKLRCNLAKSCGPCTRAGVTCSGYRDTKQLQIRDESLSTKRKAISRGHKSLPQTLTVSIYDQARNAFFAHYVSFSSTYGVLESLYAKAPSDGPLAFSVDAVSLAFLASEGNLLQAPEIASEKYSKALSLLNQTLKNPQSVSKDETLLAVLLLDLFEKITTPKPRASDPWMSHVNGALALIKLRGIEQFGTYYGLRLAMRLSTNLTISCVAANSPIPPALLKLRSELEPFIDDDDPKWRVSGLVTKYINLVGALSSSDLSTNVVSDALDLNQEFASLAQSMPSTWHYSTIYRAASSDGLFENHFDAYPDHFKTQTWNVLRVMRILLNDIVRTNCAIRATVSVEETSASIIADAATTTTDSMARDICASAFQYTGCGKTGEMRKGLSGLQRLQCYTLLFPLYVAGRYASPTTEIKTWVIKHLRLMASEGGIRNANVVADLLEDGQRTNPWSVYAILGSYAFAA